MEHEKNEEVLLEAKDIVGIKDKSSRADIRIISPEEFEEKMKEDISKMFSNVDEILKRARSIGLSPENMEKKEGEMLSAVRVLQKAAEKLQDRTNERLAKIDGISSVDEKIDKLITNDNGKAEQEI